MILPLPKGPSQPSLSSRIYPMESYSAASTTMLKAGEIAQEDYDRWRYHYPEFDTSGQWHKVVPSQGLSDMLVEAFNNPEE